LVITVSTEVFCALTENRVTLKVSRSRSMVDYYGTPKQVSGNAERNAEMLSPLKGIRVLSPLKGIRVLSPLKGIRGPAAG
jgi:hypothetical protein